MRVTIGEYEKTLLQKTVKKVTYKYIDFLFKNVKISSGIGNKDWLFKNLKIQRRYVTF